MEPPLLKGCLQKYYAQTYYVQYAHTGAMHFNFNSTNNARVSTPVQEFNVHMAYTCMCILPEARGNFRDNEISEQAN